MKKLIHFGLLLTLLLGMLSFALPAYASTPQNFVVGVGAEDVSKGVSISSFFPQIVRLHVGDSITWKINSHEIHTVTFLAGQALPVLLIPAPAGMASPLQINPLAAFPHVPAGGLYDGTTYVNSGIMSLDPGSVTTFKLTFTHVGVFQYVCLVHGMMMSGTAEVVPSNVTVLTPTQEIAQGQNELAAAWLTVPTVLAQANAQIVPPVKGLNGSTTYTVTMGYESGNIMIMRFFPSNLTVRPGDRVNWTLSSTDMEAPHTVTFFNGAPDLPLVIIAQGPSGLVALINPAVLFPSQAVLQGKSLNNTDFFNSGILVPGVQNTFSLKIGNISATLSYECILHDSSGMSAVLTIGTSFGIK